MLKVNFGSKYMKYFLASCRAEDEHQILSYLAWCLNLKKKIKITDMKGTKTAIFFFSGTFLFDLKFEF